MASWIDVCSLVMTTLFFVGVIVGVAYAAKYVTACIESTKESLEHKGITLSRGGVSLKTNSRFNREDYCDATQRGLVKALGAVTVGPESHKQAFLRESRIATVDDDAKHYTVFGMSLRQLYSGGERATEDDDSNKDQ